MALGRPQTLQEQPAEKCFEKDSIKGKYEVESVPLLAHPFRGKLVQSSVPPLAALSSRDAGLRFLRLHLHSKKTSGDLSQGGWKDFPLPPGSACGFKNNLVRKSVSSPPLSMNPSVPVAPALYTLLHIDGF